MPPVPYEVHEVIVTARPVAGVRAQVPRGRVAQEFGRYLDQVYAAARAGAVSLDGQNIFIYRAATADELTVDFWVRANDRVCAGPSWEVYGHWHVDPAQLRTDVYYLLHLTGADARP